MQDRANRTVEGFASEDPRYYGQHPPHVLPAPRPGAARDHVLQHGGPLHEHASFAADYYGKLYHQQGAYDEYNDEPVDMQAADKLAAEARGQQ